MGKNIKKFLFSIGMSSLAFLLFACQGNGNGDLIQPESSTPEIPGSNDSSTQLPTEVSQQEKIYQLAKASGYTGTYEEWLESIRGDQVELAVIGNSIQWRYVSSNKWTVLIDLDELRGEDGKDGQDGAPGKDGEDGKDGQDGAPGKDGQDGAPGKDGADGLTPYIGSNGNWWIGDEDTGISASGGSSGEDHTPAHNHTVTYHYYDGSTYSVEVECGHTIDDIGGPEIAGKLFDGWYYEQTSEKWNFMFYPVTKDTNLYAQYNSYNYSYWLYPNGGFVYDPYWTSEPIHGSIEHGNSLWLPDVYRTGYDFLGWYDSEGNEFESYSNYNYSYSQYFTALWDAKDFKITYDANGGNCDIVSETIEYGSYYELPVPTKGDELFLGWTYEGNFVSDGYYNFDTDITLMAQWKVKAEAEYDVTFNYDSWQDGVTVWTDFAIDQTIAPDPAGISEMDLSGRHTVPITNGNLDLGTYYFAVDANGYIVYASYGLGLGYGGPGDGYYHNQDYKDPGMADNWALHEEWAPWPNKTEDGRNAWNLYDFLIPTDGFVIKGYAKDPEFVSIWKLLTGQNQAPVATNNTLEGNTTPKSLDKWYFFIDSNHKLCVSERSYDQMKDENGDQKIDTPSKNFVPTDSDELIVYNTLEGVADLSDDTTIENIKVVVLWTRGNNAIVQDSQGNNILVYDPAMAEVAVGDTLSIGSAVKVTYNSYPELKTLANVTTLPAYGKLPAVAPTEVTAENVAEVWVEANNYGFYKLVKAEVIGEKQVKLGDTTIDLYSTTLPETVKVGDFIDITLTMQCYNGAVQGKGNTEDISRYYNISFDVDGVDETAQVVHAAATGAELTVTAKNENENYVFSHWAKVVLVEEETLEKVSDSVELTVTVGEADEKYVAIFEVAPWNQLPETYVETFDSEVKVNVDCGGDALSVLTSGTLHADGAWTGGFCNTSWRFIMVVDADGKIAYAVYNPANGYGGPNGTGYYAHPDYADYTTNPAFNILEGYGPWTPEDATASTKFEIKVPEGGFIVLGQGLGTYSLLSALTNESISYDNIFEKMGTINSREGLDHSARVFFASGEARLLLFKEGVPFLADGATLSFDLGANGDAAHQDGTALDETTTLVSGESSITLNNMTKVFGPAFDAKGNSCLKLGTSSKVGTFTMTVDETVDYVIFHVAGYKYNQCVVDVNGTQYIIETISNDGEYTGIKIDTTTTKTIVFTTVNTETNTRRCMINKIVLGNKFLPTLLTSETENPALEEYTVAIDANGKIVYAGYTENGYGEPDLLNYVYTDGTLKAVAGQAVAFYSLDAEWAPWPALTEDGRNAWNLYTIVVPEGMTVITGNSAEMLDLVNSLLGTTHEVLPTGDLFKEVEDASLTQTIKINEDGSVFVTYAQVGKSVGVTGFDGAAFTWDGVLGAYTATILVPKWTNFSLSYTDAEDNVVSIWYDNTSISGDIVDNEQIIGCTWDGKLFIDSADNAAAHQWMAWPMDDSYEFLYTFVYDPVAGTLVVKAA